MTFNWLIIKSFSNNTTYWNNIANTRNLWVRSWASTYTVGRVGRNKVFLTLCTLIVWWFIAGSARSSSCAFVRIPIYQKTVYFKLSVAAIQCNIQLIACRVEFVDVKVPFYSLVSLHTHKIVIFINFLKKSSLLDPRCCHFLLILNQNGVQLEGRVKHVKVDYNRIKS